jgi:hypothetical protein
MSINDAGDQGSPGVHTPRQPGALPGPATAIVAEFRDGADALQFARAKGLDRYTVTAGINHVYAVRKRLTECIECGAFGDHDHDETCASDPRLRRHE